MSNTGWRPEYGDAEPHPGTGGHASWHDQSAPPPGSPEVQPGTTYDQASPIPPYGPGPQDTPGGGLGPQAPYGQTPHGAPPYGAPPYGQAQYGQAPYQPYEHPRAASLRRMGLVSIPLAFFCNIFGIVLAAVVLSRVSGVISEINTRNLGGLKAARQARVFAIIGLVVGVLSMTGAALNSLT